jgi:inner membrane protein
LDPLTHTLVGGLLAQTGLGRGGVVERPAMARSRLPYALPIALIGANLPDLDVLAYLEGADAALGCRRGWTHGPLAIALLPLVLVGALWGFQRLRRRPRAPRTPWPRLLLLAAVAVLSHPLLDWLNTYGVRLLMPYSGRWYYGDALFIVDPWVWLGLGGALFLVGSTDRRSRIAWGALAAVVGGVVVASPRALPPWAIAVWLAGVVLLALWRWRRGGVAQAPRLATAALVALAVYAAAMVALGRAGRSWLEQELPRLGIGPPQELMVGPTLAHPLRWDVVAAVPEGYRHGQLRWLAGPQLAPRLELAPEPLPAPDPSPPVQAALAAAPGTASWLRLPFYVVDARADGVTVHLLDARYVRAPGQGFGETVVHLPPGGFESPHAAGGVAPGLSPRAHRSPLESLPHGRGPD